jgi:hypothetical protein
VFFSVMDWAVLELPTFWLAKVRDVGVNDTAGVPTVSVTAVDVLASKVASPA